MTINRMLL